MHVWYELEIETYSSSFDHLSLASRRTSLRKTELPFWRVLSFWNGTSLEAISKDPLVLITLAIYVVVRVYAHVIGVVPLSAALMVRSLVVRVFPPPFLHLSNSSYALALIFRRTQTSTSLEDFCRSSLFFS